MATAVEKLIAQLTDLKVEERELVKILESNRRKQATIINSLQVKPDANEEPVTAPRPRQRQPVVHPKRAAKALRETTRSTVVRPVATAAPRPDRSAAEQVRSAAEQVREYVAKASDDAVITPETVATALGISKTSTVSTALNRLTGKILERVPGSQRGKFRKINRAA